MKILLIANKPAFPQIDGGCVASAAFLKDLIAAQCKVTYAFLHTDKHPLKLDTFPKNVSEKANLIHSYVDTQVKKTDALKHLFRKSSYNVERFYSADFANKIEKELDTSVYDAVIFDNVFTARYLEAIKNKIPALQCYIRSHNVEHKIWEDLAKGSENKVVKWYLGRLARDLKRFELSAYTNADGILTITQDDSEVIAGFSISTPITTIPVSVELSDYVHNYENKGLFHLGSMNWRPNVEAVNTVLKYLADFQKRDATIHFSIAGIHSKERYDHLESDSVSVAGFVDDVKEFVSTQGILVAPIQSGSGVRIKILEMMALGIPVITTTLGAQGIADTSGLVIADDKDELIEAVYTLANDENKRAEIGQKAKSIITLHHNSKKIRNKILEFISK